MMFISFGWTIMKKSSFKELFYLQSCGREGRMSYWCRVNAGGSEASHPNSKVSALVCATPTPSRSGVGSRCRQSDQASRHRAGWRKWSSEPQTFSDYQLFTWARFQKRTQTFPPGFPAAGLSQTNNRITSCFPQSSNWHDCMVSSVVRCSSHSHIFIFQSLLSTAAACQKHVSVFECNCPTE